MQANHGSSEIEVNMRAARYYLDLPLSCCRLMVVSCSNSLWMSRCCCAADRSLVEVFMAVSTYFMKNINLEITKFILRSLNPKNKSLNRPARSLNPGTKSLNLA